MVKWCVSIGLHAVWLAIFLYLWNTSGTVKVEMDTLSMSITVLQTVLAIFALVGFGYIAIIAERKAHDTAKQVAENVVKSELPAMVRREIDELFSVGNVLDEVKTSKGKPQDVINSLDGDKP